MNISWPWNRKMFTVCRENCLMLVLHLLSTTCALNKQMTSYLVQVSTFFYVACIYEIVWIFRHFEIKNRVGVWHLSNVSVTTFQVLVCSSMLYTCAQLYVCTCQFKWTFEPFDPWVTISAHHLQITSKILTCEYVTMKLLILAIKIWNSVAKPFLIFSFIVKLLDILELCGMFRYNFKW